jgi:hypothetical protein
MTKIQNPKIGSLDIVISFDFGTWNFGIFLFQYLKTAIPKVAFLLVIKPKNLRIGETTYVLT